MEILVGATEILIIERKVSINSYIIPDHCKKCREAGAGADSNK